MKSIQARLSLGLVAVLVLVGLVLAQLTLWLFEAGLQRYLENGLRKESENLLVALVRGPNGLQLDERRISAAYQRPFSGYYFRIDLDQGTWRSRSLWDLDMPKPATPGLSDSHELGPEGQQLLALRADYRRLGQDISISVAQDYSPVRDGFRRLQQIGLGMGLVALLIVLVLQRITVTRSLRPLERARQQIAQLQQGQRSLLDAEVPSELAPLVDQVNHLLSHTEDSLRRSRNALGNLGHALKTPLAVLLSLASSERLQGLPEVQAQLREQLEQIQQRLARELNRARLAGDALPGAQFDCDAELPGLLSSTMSHRACCCRGIVKTCWNSSATCWTTPANGPTAKCGWGSRRQPGAIGYGSMTMAPGFRKTSACRCWSVVRGWMNRSMGMGWGLASCATSSRLGAGVWRCWIAPWAGCG